MPRGRPTRENVGRLVTERPALRTHYTGRLHVRQDRIPKGVVYAWLREYVLNEPDDTNMIGKLQSGWKAVDPKRHPELTGAIIPGRENEVKGGAIRKGGLILCEMDAREFRLRMQEKRRENLEIMQSVAWTRGDGLDEADFFETEENATSIVRTVSFKGDEGDVDITPEGEDAGA